MSESTKPFKPGDPVSCSYQGCAGNRFSVARVYSSNNCFSGFMVAAHLHGAPEREIKGIIIDGINYGVDSSYFSLIIE